MPPAELAEVRGAAPELNVGGSAELPTGGAGVDASLARARELVALAERPTWMALRARKRLAASAFQRVNPEDPVVTGQGATKRRRFRIPEVR